MSEVITLDKLLLSRERRAAKQKQLIKKHPQITLVCMTVIVPGNIKRNSHSQIIAQEGIKALKENFGQSLVFLEECDLETGFEAYMLTTKNIKESKLTTCRIEDNHPLGRLFDLDVIDSQGNPVSRQQYGFGERKCLICNAEARICMRNRTHSLQELQNKINSMIEDYLKEYVH